jgi:hypothetical protein
MDKSGLKKIISEILVHEDVELASRLEDLRDDLNRADIDDCFKLEISEELGAMQVETKRHADKLRKLITNIENI